MTRLGQYLARKMINRAELSRQTGLRTSRLNQLVNSERAKLRVDELYLIAMAIDEDPAEIVEEVCKGLKLPDSE